MCDQIKVTQLRHNKADVGPRTSDGECVTWTTLHFAYPHVTVGCSELILTGPQISLFSANISMFKLKPKYSLPFFLSDVIKQGSTKSSLPPDFVRKVLLEHVYLFTNWLPSCPRGRTEELGQISCRL